MYVRRNVQTIQQKTMTIKIRTGKAVAVETVQVETPGAIGYDNSRYFTAACTYCGKQQRVYERDTTRVARYAFKQTVVTYSVNHRCIGCGRSQVFAFSRTKHRDAPFTLDTIE